MKIPGRLTLTILSLGLLVFLGIIFRQALLDFLVRPIAILFWTIGRILASVDQAYYWKALSILGLAYIFFHLFLRQFRNSTVLEKPAPASSNVTLENVNYWRTTILVTQDEIDQPNLLKRNLGNMLAAIYASKQPETNPVEIYEGLKQQRIPLPNPIYMFLFSSDAAVPAKTFGQTIQRIRQMPQRWIRQWTKRDVKEYYQSIDQVIAFMESCMEIKHEPESFDPNKH